MTVHQETRAKPSGDANALRSLMNVGPAIEGYLHELGIRTVRDLAKQREDALYHRLQRHWGRPADPCLYDTFCAIIHEATTGEKTPWFAWTAERKRRQASGELDLRLGRMRPRARTSQASSGRARRPTTSSTAAPCIHRGRCHRDRMPHGRGRQRSRAG